MNIAAFASYILLTTFTPGPNTIMSMTNAAKYGVARTLPFCLGVFLGFILDMTLCAVATSLMFEYIPKIQPAMKWVGALYILRLALIVYRDAPAGERGESRQNPCGVLSGVVLQFVNVKVILYGVTALSVFVLPHHRSVPALAAVVLILSATGLVANCCWAMFGSLFQLVYARHRKKLNLVMALLLAYCAVATLL